MSFALGAVLTSRAQQEHGKHALACCLHPTRRTLFMVAGQVVDELDTRTGALVSRITSDLTDPIIRLEVSTSSKGHEYLLLISAANEVRIWDLETRQHLSAVVLGGVRSRQAYLTCATTSRNHERCILLYSRAGSTVLEALHLQRQLERPGWPALVAAMEPKAALHRTAAVTAVACHETLQLIAAGSADGIVTVYAAPFLDDPAKEGGGEEAGPASSDVLSGSLDEAADAKPRRSTSSRGNADVASSLTPAGIESAAAGLQPTVLMAAAISPEYIVTRGRIRKAAAPLPPPGSPVPPTFIDAAEAVTALAFHPTLPLLAGADTTGRIVVWRIGLRDATHATLAARSTALPPTLDGCGRIVSSIMFDALTPRLVTLAISPTSPTNPPILSTWCYAHSSLPPLPDPVPSPLATVLYQATTDPFAAAVEHVTMPPTLLHAMGAAGRRVPVVWASGKAFVLEPVHRCTDRIGLTLDDMVDEMMGREREGAGMSVPLTPCHATGVSYAIPVADVITAPRSWFVTGGEGDGVDLGGDELDVHDGGGGEGAATSTGSTSGRKSGLDDGASLADFAARLMTETTGGKRVGGDGDQAASEGVAVGTTGAGLQRRPPTTGRNLPSIDCVVYVQTRVEAVTNPPRFVQQHSLQVRPLGPPCPTAATLGGGASGLGSSASLSPAALAALAVGEGLESPSDTAIRLDQQWMRRVKRVCWLPGYGPGGPLLPIAIQRSPSGRFFLVRFAYVTEFSPAKAAAASNGGGSGGGYATPAKPRGAPMEALHGTPAGGEAGGNNAAAATPSDNVLYVIVGPVTGEEDTIGMGMAAAPAPSSAGGVGGKSAVDVGDAPVDYNAIANKCNVTNLLSAVDVTLLQGDRLLVVRRPAHASSGPGLTEYVVSVEPLVISFAELNAKLAGAGDGAPAPAPGVAVGAGGADSHAAAMAAVAAARRRRRKELALSPIKFAVHEPVARVFPTPYRVASNSGSMGPITPDRSSATSGGTLAVPDPALDDGMGEEWEDATTSGDVLLYATRFRSFDDGEAPDRDRIVLRYSNNAFGRYDRRNCHGYAITDAYTPVLSMTTGYGGGDGKAGITVRPLGKPTTAVATVAGSATGRVVTGAGVAGGVHDSVAPPAGGHGGVAFAGGLGGGASSADPFALPAVSATAPAPPTFTPTAASSHGAFVGELTPEMQWAEHAGAAHACPFPHRPALVLAPGETVIRVSFSGLECVSGDGGLHDVSGDAPLAGAGGGGKVGGLSTPPPAGVRKLGAPPPPATASSRGVHAHPTSAGAAAPSAVVRRQLQQPALTLASAMASGGPLLSILTSHRLLIATPSLSLLAAVPTLLTGVGPFGVGLGSTTPAWAGADSFMARTLACPSFSVWRGPSTAAAAALASPMGGSGPGAWLEGKGDEDGRRGRSRAGTGTSGGSMVGGGGTTLAVGGGYLATVAGEEGVEGVGHVAAIPTATADSAPFHMVTHNYVPIDSSATFQAGLVTNTVASAAGRAGRLTSPLPASRISDTLPSDDCPDEVLQQVPHRVAIVSHVWVGSALLFTTTAAEVWYITPLGRVRRLAGLEPWMTDAVLTTALPDRLVYTVSHRVTGRPQVRYRPFSPLEACVTATLDHATIRPRPAATTPLGGGTRGGWSITSAVPLPTCMADLTPGLAASLVVYTPAHGDKALHRRAGSTGGVGGEGRAHYVHATGAVAGAVLALAALARDYAFVRDCVVRYSHPHRVGGGAHPTSQPPPLREGMGTEWGVTPVTVAALQESGLLDLAFFAAQGHPHGADKGAHPYAAERARALASTSGAGGGEGEGEAAVDGEGGEVHGQRWFNEVGFPRRAVAIPPMWRAQLAMARGRFDQAVWAALSDEPALAEMVVGLTRHARGSRGDGSDGMGDHHDHARLPAPTSHLADRLRVLSQYALAAGEWRTALFCADCAGDAAAVLRIVSVCAMLRQLQATAAAGGGGDGPIAGMDVLSTTEVVSILTSLASSTSTRLPGISLLAIMRQHALSMGTTGGVGGKAAHASRPPPSMPAIVDALHLPAPVQRVVDAVLRTRMDAAGVVTGTSLEDEEEEEEEEEEDGDGEGGGGGGGLGEGVPALVAATRAHLDAPVYPAPALTKAQRAETLLPALYGLAQSAHDVVAAVAAAIQMGTVRSSFPDLSRTPFLPLLHDETLTAIMTAGEEGTKAIVAAAVAAVASSPVPGISAIIPMPGVVGYVYRGWRSLGGTVNPTTPPPLPVGHIPLALDSLMRWMGSSLPKTVRLGRDGDASMEGEGDEDEADVMGLDGDFGGVLGGVGGGAEAVDPLAWALLVYRGKRRLKPLPRGAEDAVIGYWRFDKAEDEATLEKARMQELRKAGKRADVAEGGVWGVGLPSDEALSPYPAPIADLSKQHCDGHLVDALFMLARGKKDVATVLTKHPLPAGVAPVGHNQFAPLVRAAFSSRYDGPCDAGDPSKVREPRALVVGLHTVPYIKGGSSAAGGAGEEEAAASPTTASGPVITIHDKVPLIPMLGAPLTTELGPGGAGLPVTTLNPGDRLLTSLLAWGFAVPLPRFSYDDVGVRPFDVVNGVFTLEAWVKVGYPFAGTAPGAEVVRGDDADYAGGDEDDAGGIGGGGGKGGGRACRVNGSIRLGRDMIIAARTERVPRTPTPTAPITTATDVAVRYQWTLAVRPDGSMAFTTFPFAPAAGGGGAASPAATSATMPGVLPPVTSASVTTPAGAVMVGDWVHVAVSVDATAAAKEVTSRLKQAGMAADAAAMLAAKSGKPSATAAWPLTPDASPLPDAMVRLFVDGVQVGEGKVKPGLPLPVLDVPLPTAPGYDATFMGTMAPPPALAAAAAGTCDHLLIAPDCVGRVTEVRLWAKRRTVDELTDGKDFHLDCAEAKKTKMQVVIKPATLPSGHTPSLAAPSVPGLHPTPGEGGSGGLKRLGGPTPTAAAPTNSSSGLPPPSSTSTMGGGSSGGLSMAPPPPAAGAGRRRGMASGSGITPLPAIHEGSVLSGGGGDAGGHGGDDFDAFGTGPPAAPVAAPASTSEVATSPSPSAETPKLMPSGKPPTLGGGLGSGLGVPPPGVGGPSSKRAAMIKAAAAAASGAGGGGGSA